MILFTSRPMPGEHASRETQKWEFYFTDHSLTGQSTSFLQCCLTSYNPRRPFFHRSHFDWRFSDSGSQTPVGDLRAAGRTVGAGAFARCSPSLFHWTHLDWEPARRIIPGNSIPKFFLPNAFWLVARHLAVCLVSFTLAASYPRTERTNFFLPIALWLTAVLPSSDARSGTVPVGTRPEDRSPPYSYPSKPTIIWCDAALATLYQVFLTDHTLTGGRVLRLLNGTMVGLIADMFLSLQCVLTVRRFRTTSAHCDDRCHCAQQRASRTCPAAAPVWRLGCSCIFFTASNW